ncbi:ABC transporter permease [Mesorhizobium sp. B2-4-12]|uniref:ABC transporter permease n=1 Tax=unclassified Mesorhizobium TaxID=325217 RepID=UPI00112A40DF|nr:MULTISPECIES: ABC transporter permease [unclassified Mesorhizobium]TPK93917.1 ABC transporter permease [Mesorhizobium sp. B2-4-12]TPL09614.1 ABC transporter permease [Mesorhizobium sp. B2-4-14]
MLRQAIAVTILNLKTLPTRFWSSLVIILGVAGVVGVVVSVLAMVTGLSSTMAHAGREDRAIILRGGSDTELSSTLSRDAVNMILDAPGIRRGASGLTLGSPEVVLILTRPMRNGGTDANVTLRGVGSQGLALRPELKLVQGRWFKPGLHELVVGKSAQRQFAGLDVGSQITLRDKEWTVVGTFESDGDAHESEIITDAETALEAYQHTLFQSVTVQLESPGSMPQLEAVLIANPQLSVEVHRETEYLAKLSANLTKMMTLIATMVGSIMAIGAVFGSLNTMYSAVSARSREIATLRAIGFGSVPIVASVMTEAMALSLLGGVTGAVTAWLLFNGHGVNALGGNFTQLVFRLTVTPGLMLQGISWALAIGFLGGLLPALRAARLPVVEALRTL